MTPKDDPMTPTELEDAISRLETAGPHISITLGEATGLVRISDLRALLSAFREQREALTDMLAGWRYIREHHGDLYGVGWDRCETNAKRALYPEGEG